MRLWTLHPQYLDPQGLVALWREALLARAVLAGQTRGYRQHPQLERFRSSATPIAAIDSYLASVHAESVRRGYSFDRNKFDAMDTTLRLNATDGQLAYEWQHLLNKLRIRSPALYERWKGLAAPQAHPLFILDKGSVATWERQ